jgi:hypothetical protein
MKQMMYHRVFRRPPLVKSINYEAFQYVALCIPLHFFRATYPGCDLLWRYPMLASSLVEPGSANLVVIIFRQYEVQSWCLISGNWLWTWHWHLVFFTQWFDTFHNVAVWFLHFSTCCYCILKPSVTFPNKLDFYGGGRLAPCPTPKLEDHLLVGCPLLLV